MVFGAKLFESPTFFWRLGCFRMDSPRSGLKGRTAYTYMKRNPVVHLTPSCNFGGQKAPCESRAV